SLEEIGGSTSLQTASAALLHALVFDVDAGFTVVDTPLAAATTSFRGPRWERLLLPCVGPEIWRMDVDDARAAALFVQQWAGTFVGVGTGAVARFGMKTPVELQETSCGCLLKFRPVGTPPAKKFEELEEGGVEFLAEAPEGEQPRLRVRRAAYSAKAVVKANSERALLEQFQRDWAEARQATRLPWAVF
ncbi:Pdrg1, partial [Symbiodinium necroappetens]